MIAVSIVIFVSFTFFTSIQGNITTINRLTSPKHIYEEIKCIPLLDKADGIPSSYDCSPFFNRDKKKCFFQGVYYLKDTQISSTTLRMQCNMGCFCSENNKELSIKCAALSCGIDTTPSQPGCLASYVATDSCCPNKICPPFTGLAKCTYKNITYFEGQRFNPVPCSTCQCTKRGILCWRKKCFAELRNLDHMDQKCAPVYRPGVLCCPTNWICPAKNDTVEHKSPNSTEKCEFGKNSFNIGDKLTSAGNTTCVCAVPPFLTCLE